jgi:hypothetical protein
MRLRQKRWLIIWGMFVAALLGWNGRAAAQVSPSEITNPRLRSAEQTYFQQLINFNRAISGLRFPFPFVLSRYVGSNPKQQAAGDKRGLEFVHFNDRVVLKISGDYNAAYNSGMLTQNQRAVRVLNDVIVPILQLLPKYFPPPADFTGVGFEIGYHVRTNSSSYSYEGAEVLTLVFNKADAFRYAAAPTDTDRQAILDNSEIFVNGDDFGLMLGQRDPVLVDQSEKDARRAHVESNAAPPVPAIPSAGQARLPGADQGMPARVEAAQPPQAPPSEPLAMRAVLTGTVPATQADADALQTRLQAQLQALDQEGRAHDHFVDYAPPSFAIFRKRIYLQMTLRNPAVFDPDATSIYKRAARSFDLFLAPRLKSLLAKVPDDPSIAGLDITVLTEFSAQAASSSEAIEYICPIAPLRSFTDADITNQELINQSIVLVNGVRIALNLQQVE